MANIREFVQWLGVCGIIWGFGYINQKFKLSGLVHAPRWLRWLCGVPRRDNYLSPSATAIQVWAYLVPILIVCVSEITPIKLRLLLFMIATVLIWVIVSLLMRIFL